MDRNAKSARAAFPLDRAQKWEALAAARPGRYRALAFAAAVFGYAAPLIAVAALALPVGVAASLLADEGAARAQTAAIVALIVAIAAFRMFLMRPREEAAQPVTIEEAPDLFALLRDVRAKIGAPKIHHVYATDELAARLCAAPSRGLYGAPARRLYLGVPLAQATSTRQFAAIVGAACGTVATTGDRRAAFVARARDAWRGVFDRLTTDEGAAPAPLRIYARAFAPWFLALAESAGRAFVTEADKAGAACADAQSYADGLLRAELAKRYLTEVFWPKVRARAHTCAKPNVAPLKHMEKAFMGMRAWPQADKWLRAALDGRVARAGEGPSLADRIAGVAAEPRVAAVGSERALTLFGPLYDTLRSEFDQAWRDRERETWAEDHERAQEGLATLAALDKRAAEGGLGPADAVERGALAASFMSREAAISRFKEAILWDEMNASAWLALGRALAEADHPRAPRYLERAAMLDARLGLAAASVAYRYHTDRGDVGAAADALESLRVEGAAHDFAEVAVATLDPEAPMVAHGLYDDAVAPVAALARRVGDVKAAYLVRKEIDAFDGYCGYHLILTPAEDAVLDAERAMRLMRRAKFLGPLFLWIAEGEAAWMARAAAKAKGAALDLASAERRDGRRLADAA